MLWIIRRRLAEAAHVSGDQRGGTRREALAFPGVDPKTGRTVPIQLAFEKIRALPKLGAGKVKEAGFIVPEVLAKPTAIFQGLTRDADDSKRGAGWRCYAGRPGKCFEDDGRSVPPPPNRVFVVFVNDENVAYNWYWCSSDPSDATLPEGYAERFHERLI